MPITVLYLVSKSGARCHGRQIDHREALGHVVCASEAAADLLTRSLPQHAILVDRIVTVDDCEGLLDLPEMMAAQKHVVQDAITAAARVPDSDEDGKAEADAAIVAEQHALDALVEKFNGEQSPEPVGGDDARAGLDSMRAEWLDPLASAGFAGLESLAGAMPEDLDEVEGAHGLGPATAQRLIEEAQRALVHRGADHG